MCILDIIDNLPRLRISDSLMKVLLWAMKECGARNVPSFYSLRKTQKALRTDQGIPNIECKSVQGKIFYINDPRNIIANDWANPSIRKYIHLYPEIPSDGIIREVWHADKWRNMNPDVLSPMYDSGHGRHFYIYELTRLNNGQYIIPIRWVIWKKKVCADAYNVNFDANGIADVDDSKTVLIETGMLKSNYLDLQAEGQLPGRWSDRSISAGHATKMPNRYRQIAGGDPLYVSFIDYFGDDVSGNRSKSWNKHNNSYITHRNLPRKLLQQEFHIHLISTSQHATIPEQYHDVKKIIEKTHVEPVSVQDETGLSTKFMLQLHADPSDNPAQSEVASHIGAKGNHPCRKCDIGGTEVEKSTDSGFHAMFEPGAARNQDSIRNELELQVTMACKGVAKHVEERQTETGTKDTYTQYWIEHIIGRFRAMRAEDPTKTKNEIQNILLQWATDNSENIYNSFATTKGFDPAQDTPIEILHTILLGVVKYIWHYSHTAWKPKQKELYAHRLQATDVKGLSINAIRAEYITNFANSLVGRQFKTVVQTAIFHLHDIVDEKHFKAWKAVGVLSALLWQPEIDDIDQYCKDVEIAVANVQDMFAEIDPTKIIRKTKLHLLSHISEDVRRFGPLVGMATEIFESFNAVFRFCSVLSNHQSPSRDISRQTGQQESLKHRLTGGRWFNMTENHWASAGAGVREFIQQQPLLQSILGWTNHIIALPRKGRRVIANDIPRECRLDDTNAKLAVNWHEYNSHSETWIRCKSVVSESLDYCTPGSWVFCKSPINGSPVMGRINEILVSNKNSESLVILEEFQVSSSKDTFFDLPYVFRRQGETSFVIMPATNLLFIQNVQHDCRSAKCAATGVRSRQQERKTSDQTENFIEHKSGDRFLINLNAFHNAHLIRRTLPRELTAPVPLFSDREQQHKKNAQILRKTLFQQKEETQRKKETKKKQENMEDELIDKNDTSKRPRIDPMERSEVQDSDNHIIAHRPKPRPKPRYKQKNAAGPSNVGIVRDED
ncbi:hypothetical protein K435DRAFT_820025 [Dendrothele bispora CBS 962.96]|uniref:Uncharacterized protein n=1 Tax=Dendrothele bispora (strain CBS 962.96) TaxID=1314807 RepID=A0A4S8LXS4_DENBC|nr:hypothetical protein K435DRAFT_820025 [Dendrothele bispora CBS 962.96]